jgi:F0F1-type ATP synthase membrane subunit a
MTPYFDIDRVSDVFKPVIDRILEQKKDVNPAHKKRIEKRLQKAYVDTDTFVFEFTRRQTSILLTAMTLVKFEIISKSNYQQAKPTLQIMDELIKLLQTRLNEVKK